MQPIKVIDLFAGPGGLGEGFGSVVEADGKRAFQTITSIEMDQYAHKTLKLRAFYRQFIGEAPEEYYQFLRGELGSDPEERLYKFPKFQSQVKAASEEALKLELGKDNATIFSAIRAKLRAEDECVLIGGPPCQAYSVAGKARNLGNSAYDPLKDPRNFLYREYLKVIAKFQPLVFVMENVKGMLSAKVGGGLIYDSIKDDLQRPCESSSIPPEPGRESHRYEIFSLVKPGNSEHLSPKDFIIHSEKFGIPQRRHRVILLGVRSDVIKKIGQPPVLEESNNSVCTKDVIADLPKIRSGLSKGGNADTDWLSLLSEPMPRVAGELRTAGFGEVATRMDKQRSLLKAYRTGQGLNQGLKQNKRIGLPSCAHLEKWYRDERLFPYVLNHDARNHKPEDLHRYFFSSVWAEVALKKRWKHTFPKSQQYPNALKPAHKNFDSGKFSDRFRVQLPTIPATTITSHISKDGHYYIHYDPLQARSLTVREAARIQTFPDNYFFVGPRTAIYHQVGNAVPPFLANKIATIVQQIISQSENSKPS